MSFPQPELTPTPVPASREERTWAMVCHLITLTGFFIPLGNIIGPLVIWLIKKEQYPLVDDQGREALNFQISILIYLIASLILLFVLIGIVLLPIVLIFDLVMTIVAMIKANDGVAYRYPLTIRFF